MDSNVFQMMRDQPKTVSKNIKIASVTLGFFVEIVTQKISASPSTSPSASKHPLVLPSDEEEYWDTHCSGGHRKMPVYLPFGGPLDDARVGCCARLVALRDHNSVVFETQEVILGVLNMP